MAVADSVTDVTDGPGDEASAAALGAIQGANPFVGLTRAQMVAAVGRWAARLARDPAVLVSRGADLVGEELRVLAGASTVEPDKKDKRFADPAWEQGVWRRIAQSYVLAGKTVQGLVDDVDLDQKSADRARFVLMQLTEALAPTNNLLTNPTALRKAVRTRGRSLVDGGRHLAYDLRHNGGLPSQVDTRPFRVGETIAVTPGAVVARTEQYELLQYQPTTPDVAQRPVVVIPPQINKYYFLDLAPGRSFVEYAVSRGLQVFVVSWRNPEAEQRDWSIDTYVEACAGAIETACDLAGSDDAIPIGFCSGGMTLSLLLGHLAATGHSLVHASALAVTMTDTAAKSAINLFVSRRSAAAAIARSRRKGMLDGRSVSRVFSWVRPNDLVWNYWVSNYLLGETPPPFDVLAWNADHTNLPAALHAGFVQIMMDNALVHPGKIEVLGTPIDLATVKTDQYVVGASTDHLVPWESAYAATRVHGGTSRFVLSNSGHIQALVNPPGNPKASFLVGDDLPDDPEEWLATATRHTGSWWTDWADWVLARAGDTQRAPRRLGSRRHPVLGPAPGTYVLRKDGNPSR